jgi:uncharacterized membrane protein
MLWLTIALCSYLILAVVSLVDKFLLTKTTLMPKTYAFYVGVLQVLALILIFFVDFSLPGLRELLLSLISGVCFILGLYWLFKALHLFEASRIVPAVGGLTPLFSLGLIFIFSLGQEKLVFSEIISFGFLIAGSILINVEPKKKINLTSLKMSLPAGFFLALSFILIKYVYLVESFWNGLIWRSIGSFLFACCFFIVFPEIKKEIFKKQEKVQQKTFLILISNQAAGATANILQTWAVFLAPLVFVPFVHALQGAQYVFLLIFVVFLSFKMPWILKEEITRKVIFQKIVAILLIIIGLILISLK